MIEFPFYENKIYNTKPIKKISLYNFFNLIKNSTPELIKIFEKLKQTTNQEEKRKLKEHLYYATPAVQTDMQGRKYTNITNFTGLMPLDFDKLDFAEEFKHYIFDNYPYIIASWLSASGKGVRCLVNIPVVFSVDDFKSLFWGLAKNGFMDYKGFDIAPQNCVLPFFISYDKNILIRDNAEQWTKKYIKPVEQIKIIPNFNFSSKYEKWSISNFKKAIDKIVDNGHPQLRAAAYVLGGRVGAGYLSEYTAIQEAWTIIETNNYLSKGYAGYKKTAKDMIIRGQKSPLYYEK